MSKNYITVLIVVICTIGCGNDLKDSKNSDLQVLTPLKIISTLSDSSFYGSIGDITVVDDRIYMYDNSPSILIMDKDLTLLKRISNVGQGPGEFTGISNLKVQNNKFYILNLQEQKILEYKTNGDFSRTIIPDGYARDIAIDKSGNIFTSNPYSEKPLSKLDSEGKLITEFGNKLPIKVADNIIIDETFLMVADDKLIVINKSVPVVDFYSMSGELLKNQTFTHPLIEERFKAIERRWIDNDWPAQAMVVSILFSDISIDGGRIVLTLESNKKMSLPDYALAYNFTQSDSLIYEKSYEIPSVRPGEAMNAFSFAPLGTSQYLLFDLHTGQLMIYE